MALPVPKRLRGIKTISHVRSPKQEKVLAKRLGAKRVSGSGSGTEKGDVRKRGIVRVECKNTVHSSFSITFNMLDKIENAALMSDELPVIQIDFIDLGGKVRKSCCVVPTYVLDEIANK